MASPLESLAKYPPWQLGVGWLVGTILMVAGWHFLYFSDALDTRDSNQLVLDKSQDELKNLETKLENFEEEMEKAAIAQREIEQSMDILPLSASSVEHLMRTFQQQGRLVGISLDRWNPGAEQKTEYYARFPVEVIATGTWNQLGEFFRRISEMSKIVNIDKLDMSRERKAGSEDRPTLSVTFQASTFRFLSEEERSSARGQRKSSRRKGNRK